MYDELKILQRSPMFQLSMGSKEQFHSNFLYWLSLIDQNKFVKLLNTILNTNDVDCDWGNWSAKREHKHLDFCIISTEHRKERIQLVLENKFKSIPSKTQLDRYFTNTPNCKHYILLTLIEEFPYKEDIKNWKIVSYKDLSISIDHIYRDHAGYEGEIIRDYSAFISAFHNLSAYWKVERDNLLINNRVEYQHLRINDIYQKVIYSQLLAMIISDMGISENKVLRELDHKEMFEIFSKESEESKNHIFVNSGLTNNQGLLEIKVRFDKNTAVLIQLQGRQYRRCIERNTGSLCDNFNWLCSDDADGIRELFSYNEHEQPCRPYPDGLCRNAEPYKVHDEDKHLNGFCKFGNGFIYQYVKIDKNVSVGTIINAVVSDVEYFRSKTSMT